MPDFNTITFKSTKNSIVIGRSKLIEISPETPKNLPTPPKIAKSPSSAKGSSVAVNPPFYYY
jgi:hypothetical protein